MRRTASSQRAASASGRDFASRPSHRFAVVRSDIADTLRSCLISYTTRQICSASRRARQAAGREVLMTERGMPRSPSVEGHRRSAARRDRARALRAGRQAADRGGAGRAIRGEPTYSAPCAGGYGRGRADPFAARLGRVRRGAAARLRDRAAGAVSSERSRRRGICPRARSCGWRRSGPTGAMPNGCACPRAPRCMSTRGSRWPMRRADRRCSARSFRPGGFRACLARCARRDR